MTSVLDRAALEGSPLADLHVIAAEIGVEAFRRLRKAELVDAIIAKQSGDGDAAAEDGATDESAAEKPKRPRRSRARSKSADEETVAAVEAADEADAAEEP